MNQTPTQCRSSLKLVALLGTLAFCAGSVQAQGAFEYDLHVVEPFYDSTTSESYFVRVLDDGTAWGTSTVLTQLPSGNFSVTNQSVTWSSNGTGDTAEHLNALNNRGDRVMESPHLQWATVEYVEGGSDQIDVFVGDVALRAWDISESRMVVGASIRLGSISQGVLRDAFFWTESTGIVNLKSTGLVPDAGQVWSVNDSGEMVGIAGNGRFDNNQAFYFDFDTSQHIDLHSQLVPDGQVDVRSDAYDINNNGIVVGSRDSGFGGDIRAFAWSQDAGVSLLPAPMTQAWAINDAGVIVGGNWKYSNEDGLVDLNSLAEVGDFQIVDARDISNTGIIVGWGRRSGSALATAFMLTPAQNDCAVDINEDQSVNFLDVSAFLAAFSNDDPAADFTNDGQFNFLDVSAFLTEYGFGCP
jgi:hypothetical protein